MIGFLVLPPGHGKSYHHSSIPGLVEADTIYDCRGDDELKELRLRARITSDWSNYDEAWASRIKVIIGDNNWVIMVPNRAIGDKLNGTCLGIGQLSNNQWDINLKKRGKTSRDYEYSRQIGPEVVTFETNLDLHDWIVTKVNKWFENHPVTLKQVTLMMTPE